MHLVKNFFPLAFDNNANILSERIQLLRNGSELLGYIIHIHDHHHIKISPVSYTHLDVYKRQREWSEMDLEDFFEYAKVDGVGQMAGWNPHTSIQESKTILEMFINEKMTFALELKENHKVIGSLGLETLSLLLRDEYENLVGRELGLSLIHIYANASIGLWIIRVIRIVRSPHANEDSRQI